MRKNSHQRRPPPGPGMEPGPPAPHPGDLRPTPCLLCSQKQVFAHHLKPTVIAQWDSLKIDAVPASVACWILLDLAWLGLKVCDPVHVLSPPLYPINSNWRFWYHWEAHNFLITPVKFPARIILGVMVKKLWITGNGGIPPLILCSLLWIIFWHISACNINMLQAM